MGLNLSDNEKRDIVKYLESGKPLPDKYRFLLFGDNREVELVWNGKTDEVTNVVLPFQTIEQIDEPRSNEKFGNQETLFDTSGRQIAGWTNKLIWGDNKLILSSLKNGPMRKEIEAQGGLKLIYIDPPFDVGADFSMDITIGDGEDEESFTKKPSVIEEIAYRDTWGKGADSFIAMIYERLKLMHDLLAEDGCIYLHCDWRVNSHIRLILDELFSQNGFINQITWKRTGAHNDPSRYGMISDTIFLYAKSDKYCWNQPYGERSDESLENSFSGAEKPDGSIERIGVGEKLPKGWRRFQSVTLRSPSPRPNLVYEYKGYKSHRNGWSVNKERMEQYDREGKLIFPQSLEGAIRLKMYLDESPGIRVQDMWTDIGKVEAIAKENLGYATQKPEMLLERIISTSSNEGDIVADFFCGSGTTLAVAEKLGRKWIGSDLGKFGIHTSRKRMIGIQRELKKDGKDFRAFEILNVGKYERENFIATNDDLRAEEKAKQTEKKEKQFIALILSAYKAEPAESFLNIVGKKRDRLVAIGPVNLPASEKFIQNVIDECKEKGFTKIDVLAFDYEMGIDRHGFHIQGVDIALKIIPREVFDKKAVEKGQVKFYDVAFIEVNPIVSGRGNVKEVSVELTDFSVFYNQDESGEIEEALKPGGSKVIVENGQVIKLTKDKQTEIASREVLTKKWSDWIDYWAVDYDFTDRKEIIRVTDDGGEKEVWTGDYVFDNEWQSFRTKKNRTLELTSAPKEMPKGNYKVAVKVVDIFGNDTTKVIEVKI